MRIPTLSTIAVLGSAALGAALLPAQVAAAVPAPDAAGSTQLTGELPDGATWQAEIPADWNGTAVLFSHGFRGGEDNPAWDQSFAPTAEALNERGVAVVASSYATTGWALGTAAQDQLDALAEFEAEAGDASRVIAMGRSMGGLVTSLLAERPDAGIDGAVSTCGLLGGGVSLNNYQLDAAHAALTLLAPDADVPLVGFTDQAQSQGTVEVLSAALDQALTTPQGRARVSLVAALLNAPTELPGVDRRDPEALAAAQAAYVQTTLPEVISRRSAIVNAAGGDSGWTAGVDYAALLRDSSQRHTVRALYRDARLDLRKDLAAVTSAADVEPDEDALDWMLETSVPTGKLQVPELTTHTLIDTLAPVEYQEEYAETVRRAGKGGLLRQAFVDREGHCEFTVAENLAAFDALEERLDTGRWGRVASTGRLQESAEQWGESDYVDFRPGEFVNDRQWKGQH
ncbi:alpha/beta hydrolase family protein [Nocardioides insulae]|uniref:alpha/beta hydrolase family protein n=1 Tax=Nocardioides insulae TaxID=394734 RepID=UPI0006865144|nr:alpha/beta hydrolase [Nocardioides insulae]